MDNDPEKLIKSDRLTEAKELLMNMVKEAPFDIQLKNLLFQTLIFCGEWELADNHLDHILHQKPENQKPIDFYKQLLKSEKLRKEISKTENVPILVPEIPTYMDMYLEGKKKLMSHEIQNAASIFNKIDSSRSSISGTLNEKPFDGFNNIDMFLSFFLEAFINDQYVWIPFEYIKTLKIPLPQTLYDLIWTPSNIIFRNGICLNCYLPVLYPDSSLHENDKVKLGRMTDWVSFGMNFYQGQGQQMFKTNDYEFSILEIRELALT